MKKLSHTRLICITAMCVALCCVLPTLFHSTGLGTAFSPLHIPPLLCGLICGPVYGTICGLVGPILSCMITSMPGAAMLPTMVPELMVYGLTAGLMMRCVRSGKLLTDLYISLCTAMILGRMIGGIAKALFYMGTTELFTIGIWFSSYFVATLPGIMCHLIVIPLLVLALSKTNLIPARYPKGAS